MKNLSVSFKEMMLQGVASENGSKKMRVNPRKTPTRSVINSFRSPVGRRDLLSLGSRMVAVLCLLLTLGVGKSLADSDFSHSYIYSEKGTGTGKTWNITNAADASTYWKAPDDTEEVSVATVSGIFTGKTITSNVVITLDVACYGSGSNPTSDKFSIYNSSDCSSQVIATQGGTLPSSSTYTVPTYTISKANAVAGFSNDLVIRIASGTKQIRFRSFTVAFSYTEKVAEPYTVTFYKPDGTTDPQTEGSAGAGVTPPTVGASCSGWTFQGWSTSQSTSTTSTTVLSTVTLTAGKYYPTANTTLYPVYTKTGSAAFSRYEKVTSAPTDWTANKYVIATADAGKVLTGKSGDNNYGGYATMSTTTEQTTYEITLTTVSTGVYKIQQNSKYLSLSANDNKLYFPSTYTGASDTHTNCDWAIYYYSTGGGYVVESTKKYTINGTSNCYRAIQFNSDRFACYKYMTQTPGYLYKRIEAAPTYYYSYPSCCDPLGQINGSVSLSKTAYTITATWPTTEDGNETGYSVQLYDNSAGAIGSAIGDPVEIDGTGSSARTHTFGAKTPAGSRLTANHKYYVGVTPTYDGAGDYCPTGTEKTGNVTTNQVYTVTYNANGGTVTTLPSGGTYEEDDEVTVANKPATTTKSGHTFTGWNTAANGSGTHYDADGSTTFDMPNANVTLYAEWTAKKNYYVDRMHGNNDGEHTVEIDGVEYDCYLREGAGYTVPDLSDNSTGDNSCVTGHEHFLGWVVSSKIGAQGQLLAGYTIIAGGGSKTATDDGTIYYAVWAEDE